MESISQTSGRIEPYKANLIETVDLAANLAQKRIDKLGRLLMCLEIIPIVLCSSAISKRRTIRVITEVRPRVIIQADGATPGKASLGGLRQQNYPVYGAKLEDINRELWEVATEYDLFSKIVQKGYLTEADILLLQAHFADSGAALDPCDKRFTRLSIAVANLA